MMNINLLPNLFIGWFVMSLDSCYILAGIFAISVITVKNPIISVLFLIGLFITIGSYLIIIGVSFIGLSYLLVYVGAVSILFLFILMLINVRISELVSDTKNSIPLIFLVTLVFGNVSYILLPQENISLFKEFSWEILNNTFINSLNNWDSYLVALPHITNIGNVMYSTYAVWLLLISFVLLLAMVGAIIINVQQKNFISRNKTLSQDYIVIQSKLDFPFLKPKLLKFVITGSIIWCIRYLIVNIFGLDISEYISYLGMYVFVGSIQVLLDYYIFMDYKMPMGPSSEAFKEVSKYDHIHLSEKSKGKMPDTSENSASPSSGQERNEILREIVNEFNEFQKEKQDELKWIENARENLESDMKDRPKLDDKNEELLRNMEDGLKKEYEKLKETVQKDAGYNTLSDEVSKIAELMKEMEKLDSNNEADKKKIEEMSKEVDRLNDLADENSGGFLKKQKELMLNINSTLTKYLEVFESNLPKDKDSKS